MKRKAELKLYFLYLIPIFLIGSYFCSFLATAKEIQPFSFFTPAAPTVNSATSVTTTGFDISWSAVTGATDYRVDVSTSPSFGSFVPGYNDLSVAGTTLSIGGLTSGQTYYYRVRSFDGIGYSVNSNIRNITTVTDSPILTGPTFITSTSFRINWILSNGATGYEVDLATDAGFSSMVLNSQTTASTFYDVLALAPGTTYYYRVRAVTSGGKSDNSSEENTTTIPVEPLAIAASSINSTDFIANWNNVSGASEYRLDLSLYSSFSSFVPGYADYPVFTNNLLVTGLVEGQTYYYRVRSVSQGGTSDNSNTIITTTVPVSPVANPASGIAGTSFTAKWENVSGATEYRIDVSTNSSFGSTLASYSNKQVLTNSVSVTGLTSTTTYYYRVRAISSGGASNNSNTIIVPGAPIALSASGASTTSFEANWSSITDASEYRLDVSTDAGFSSILSSYNNLSVLAESQTVSGLTAGQTYYYRVRAVSSGGTSINSNSINITTVPLAPSATAATGIDTDEFTANWNSTTGASGYKIDVATDNLFTSLILNDFSATGTSSSVTGLNPGQTYYYRIRAASSGGSSTSSNIITLITTPDLPVTISATGVTASQFISNWNAVTGSDDYLLDVSTNSGFTSFLSGYNGFVTSSNNSTINSLLAGTTYYFRVRARNSGGISGYSNTTSVVTTPPVPSTIAASGISSSSFTAKWNSATGATGYKLDVAEDNSFTSILAGYSDVSVVSTSYSVVGLTSGITYYYRVRAINAGGTSSNSNVTSVITVTDPPIADAATSILNNGFTANWQSSIGATSYQIDVSLSNTFSPNLSGYNSLSVTGTNYSVTGLASGQTYYYRIRAVNSGGVSTHSNIVSTITLSAAPPANSATSITTISFTANWNPVLGATSYLIDVATDLGFTSILASYNDASVTGTSYVVSSLTPGTLYYYRVRAANSSGIGANSNTISVVTVPPAPLANAASSVTASSFTANWASTTGATDYRIDVSTNSGFTAGNFVGSYNNLSVSGQSVSVTGLSAGSTYYYRVRGNNSSGVSVSSNVINAITISNPPVAIAATNINGTSFTANWNSVASAADYRLDVSTNSSFSSFVSGYNDRIVAGLSENVTGLTSGQTYYYRVRSVNTSGFSSNSNNIIVPGSPIATVSTSNTTSSFNANWNSVTGATSYYIDVATDNSFSDILTGYNNLSIASNSVSVTSLSQGSKYFYRIRAISSGGTSINSNVIEATTISAAPVANSATSVTNTSFTANWSPSIGASSYRLDVATDALFTSILSSYNNVAITGTSHSITGLSDGQAYYYRVRAINAGGVSSNSNVINLTTIPVAPVALASSNNATTSFVANWGSVTGASSYQIDVSTDNLFSNILTGYNNLSVTGVSVTITGRTAGNTYFYRVRAVSSGGISTNSNIIEANTISLAPAILGASGVTTTTFQANWSSSTGATSYRLDVSTNSTFTAILGSYNNITVSGTSYDITGLNPGIRYFYRVRAANPGGISSNSSSSNVITISLPPTALAANPISTTSFTAKWNFATGASSYKFDLSLDPNFSSYVGLYNNFNLSSSSASLSVSGLEAGSTYYYRLRTFNGSGTSENSNVITVTTVPSAVTDLTVNQNTISSFVLNWNSVTGASGYKVDISTVSNFSSLVSPYNNYDVTVDSLLISGLIAGTKYFYRLRAYTSGGLGAYTSDASHFTFTIPNSPTAISASSITSTGFTVNWTGSMGASNYVLDINTQPDFSVPFDSYSNYLVPTSPLSHSITGISQGVTYYFRVRAENGGGQSANSNVIIIPGSPLATLPGSLLPTEFVANWNAVSGASYYKLEVYSLPSFTPVTGYEDLTVNTNSQRITGLTPGVSYLYRVRAVSNGGISVYSNSITLPGAPVCSAGTSITTQSFDAHWSAVDGATEYRLDVSSDPVFGNFITGYENVLLNSSTLNYTITTGLTPGTTYYYRVRAISSGSPSINSNVISLITVPSAPLATAANNISTTSFDANWNSTPGAASYRLDVSSNSSFSTFVGVFENYAVPGTTFSITGLTIGQNYYFRVRAVNSGGTSLSSNTILVKTGSVNITAPSLMGICTNGNYASLGDIIITEGSNDVFKSNTDSVTLSLSIPSGFELMAGVGSASKIQGDNLLPGIRLTISPSTITIKYLVSGTSGLVDALKISGLKIRAVGSASSGQIKRSGGTAEQAGNNIADAVVHANLSSNTTTPAIITNLGTSYCVNQEPLTLIGSPADNDGPGGVVGVFSGRGVSGNVFDPAVAGVGFDTLYYSFTNLSGCTYLYTHILYVNPLNEIDFYVNKTDTAVCNKSGYYTLDGSASGGSFDAYPGVTPNPSGGYTFYPSIAGIGSHNLTYRYTNSSNCESIVTKTIYVNPEPVSKFNLSDFCDGKRIDFTDASMVATGAITEWLWDFGDNNTSTLKNPTHLYAFDGKFTVSLTVVSNSGCTSTKSEEVRIGKTPSPLFAWENGCLGNATKFTDITGIDETVVERIWDFGDGFTSSDVSPEHIYANPGVYKVKLTIRTNANCFEDSIINVPVFPYISSYPYSQNFEEEENGWVSGGVNSSWTLTTPSGTIINKSYSGRKAWVTNKNGSYNNNEKSYIEGPCFNLTGLNKPMISFKIWVDTDKGADGTVLQATTDNGKTWQLVGNLTEGIGWYDSSPIIGGPGGQQIMGWSGRDLQKKWREAKFRLDEYKNASSIRFRISFGSSSENPANSNYNGIAVDDVWVGERSHIVLVEHFMNNDLGMEEAHVISDIASQPGTELIDINYHTSFPQADSYNAMNPGDPSARALYYGIKKVPHSVLDGALKVEKFSNLDKVKYESASLKESSFDISLNIDNLSEPDKLKITIEITALDTVSAPVIVNTAVLQNYLHGEHRMRFLNQMLPDAAGIKFKKRWEKGDKETISFTWIPRQFLEGAGFGVVVFIQNKITKEVFQTQYKETEFSEVTGREDQVKNNAIALFPNPAKDEVNLMIEENLGGNLQYEIIDAIGKIVLTGKIQPGQLKTKISTRQLKSAVYTVRLLNAKGIISIKKLVIAR